MRILDYADKSLQPHSRLARICPVLVTILLALVGFFPFIASFLNHFEPQYSVRLLWPEPLNTLLGVLIAIVIMTTGILFIRTRMVKSTTRQTVRAALLVLASVAAIPILVFTDTHRDFLVTWVNERHVASAHTFFTLRTAIERYLAAHTNPAWGDVECHYPPHLAALVAGGYLKPSDLVLPHSGTSPAIVPAGLVEADWPKIAHEIETHSDIVYRGKDLTCHLLMGGVHINFVHADSLVIAYSNVTHYKRGILILKANGLDWNSPKDLPAMLAKSDLIREYHLYPPLSTTTTTTTSTLVSAPLAAALTPEIKKQREKQFCPMNLPPEERPMRNPVRLAILNYAIDHDGYFPPHLAALLAGHYIQPADLVDPAYPTKPYGGNLDGLTESDWPAIATEVDKHCDLLYCAADVRLNPVPIHQQKPNADLIILFTKVVTTPSTSGIYDYRYVFKAHSSGLEWSWGFFSHWRTDWAASNEIRAALGLSPQDPEHLPAITVPAKTGYVAPGTPDPASPEYHRQIASRNLMVLTHQLLANDDESESSFYTLWRFRRISARHLYDPDLHPQPFTPADLPPQVSRLYTTVNAPWRGDSSSFNSLVDSSHFDALVDFKLLAWPKTMTANTPIAITKNNYGRTGRYVAYFDGSVRFVPYKELPKELQ